MNNDQNNRDDINGFMTSEENGFVMYNNPEEPTDSAQPAVEPEAASGQEYETAAPSDMNAYSSTETSWQPETNFHPGQGEPAQKYYNAGMNDSSQNSTYTADQSQSQPQEEFGTAEGQYRSTPHEVHYMNNSKYYSAHEINEPVRPQPVQSKGKTRKSGNKFWKRAVAFAVSGLIFGAVAGGAFLGVTYLGGGMNNSGGGSSLTPAGTGDVEVRTSSTADNGGAVVTDITNVVEEAMPSVVAITNTTVSEVRGFFGGSETLESSSSGSGIIVGQSDTELLIATNNHVIEEANTLSVCFIDNEVVEAKVKGTDAANDLAVIAVKVDDVQNSTLSEISIATQGASDNLKVGEPVIAIGNALGYGQSVTTGVLSARDVVIEDLEGTYIQTDAAINPGNSGGALLNINGELIGINAAKVSGSGVEGMGYAIPISVATPILDNLMSQETRDKVAENQRGYLGISCLDVTSEVSQMYDMPVGVRISEAFQEGAASQAGIQKGDIITKLDNTIIDSYVTLNNTLEYYRKGEEVTVTVERFGSEGEYEELEFQVTLGAKM